MFGMCRWLIIVIEYINELMYDNLIVLYFGRKNGEVGNGLFF